MKTLKFALCGIAAVLVIFCTGLTDKKDANLREFLKETTITYIKGNQTQSAIWLAPEFNEKAAKANSEPQKKLLNSYLIFLSRRSIDTNDNQINASWAQIQNKAILRSRTSEEFKPLALVPVGLARLLEEIKNTIIENGGSITNFHILIFDAKDSNGIPIIDTTKKDRITLVLQETETFSRAEFTWHTPFDAVADAGICPKCGEKVKAQWFFCPFCGNKL